MKKEANTAYPRQSLFLRKMSCLGWDSNPRHSIHSRQSALPLSYMYIIYMYTCIPGVEQIGSRGGSFTVGSIAEGEEEEEEEGEGETIGLNITGRSGFLRESKQFFLHYTMQL